jgi:VWFA-related protein
MRVAAIGAIVMLTMANAALAQFEETITVARVLIDARVTNDRGDPIADLKPSDLIVKIGGEAANVESATYIDESAFSLDDVEDVEDATSSPTNHQPTTTNPSARLFIVFVQTDFARNPSRVSGQLHFNRYATEFIEALQPDDRVAVLSFDSHLKFRLDFTSDKEEVSNAIRASLLIDEPPAPPIVHSPALFSRLDRDAMKRAATSEAALLIVGNALMPIEGPKNVILMGWGLGDMSGMLPEWKAARRALDAARATLFAFDTTRADYHSLEVGLQTAAAETGGFYAKTHVFPEFGLERLERTLRGRYELELRVPATLSAGTHELSIRVKRRGANVLAPSSIVVR